MILDKISYALIIEDDITITEQIRKLPRIIQNLPNNWDIVWIGNSKNTYPRNTCSSVPIPQYNLKNVKKISSFLFQFDSQTCQKTNDCPLGAYAYLLSNQGAYKIIHNYQINKPIDYYFLEDNSLNKFFTIPSLITHCYKNGSYTNAFNDSTSESRTANNPVLYFIILLQIILFFVFFLCKGTTRTVITLFISVLIVIGLNFYKNISTISMSSNNPFENIWTKNPNDYLQVTNIMNNIYNICNTHNVEYYFTYGTLLGYARHNYLIPWDDDIDLAIDENDLDIFVKKCLPDLKKLGISNIKYKGWVKGLKYKLFYPNAKKINNYEHKWPFIDIFIYKKINDYQILDIGLNKIISLNNKFKLIPVKMKNIYGYVPREYENILNLLYPNWKTECISSTWNHRKEQTQMSYKTKCEYLL